MNLISLKKYDTAQIEKIIDASIKIKQEPKKYCNLFKNKKMYMLFEKTSTRTSVAFGMGFNEHGGKFIMQRWEDSNFAVGEVVDETRYVARNVDILLARLKLNETIELIGNFSTIPVINGCCNKYHPTQVLADCMTIKEIFGTYNVKLAYIGVWNNVFNSLVLSFARLGGKLIGVCPIINEAAISKDEIAVVVKNTENLEIFDDKNMSPAKLTEIVNNVDVVYTDTWVDMEFFDDPNYTELKDAQIKLMTPFSLTKELLRNSKAKVMHDMPIHPGFEIERNIVESHIDTILHQAENRRHVAKGIFTHLLDIEVKD
ncbi:MAG: ornithine carbamoyltransferase [Deltaproteobacteria bacterium]|nr:ornithine carbamoyltransferase [Deltaproteobacteria bacterium]